MTEKHTQQHTQNSNLGSGAELGNDDMLIEAEFGPMCRQTLLWGSLTLASGFSTYHFFSRGDTALGVVSSWATTMAAAGTAIFSRGARGELRGARRSDTDDSY
ncbi:MAG: hypothetical protein KDD70_13895 [Bdellovibrionales bacterium]|nr:hypothetical protein [Bdellovibrionales bacterium]